MSFETGVGLLHQRNAEMALFFAYPHVRFPDAEDRLFDARAITGGCAPKVTCSFRLTHSAKRNRLGFY